MKDFSKASPWMKQQYTYKDLQDAYNAGSYSDEYIMNGFPTRTFEEWFKDHIFEMDKLNQSNDNANIKKLSENYSMKLEPLPDKIRNHIPSGTKLISWDEYAKICGLKDDKT